MSEVLQENYNEQVNSCHTFVQHLEYSSFASVVDKLKNTNKSNKHTSFHYSNLHWPTHDGSSD
jgi:hypothetical protein